MTTYWLGTAPNSQSLTGNPGAALTLAIRSEKSIQRFVQRSKSGAERSRTALLFTRIDIVRIFQQAVTETQPIGLPCNLAMQLDCELASGGRGGVY